MTYFFVSIKIKILISNFYMTLVQTVYVLTYSENKQRFFESEIFFK